MALDYIYSDLNNPTKMIVWDLGRRCNFDCTYCTSWMHSTSAPMNKFEQYKKTADFIHKYYQIYAQHHNDESKWNVIISFTGGEPAINPAFYELVPYLKENFPYMKLNLTTNGTWGERKGQFLLDNMNSITISYHCEGTAKQKELIRKNLLFVRTNIKNPHKLKVNVMMHQDYFDECVDLIENFLKPNDIRYIPRVVGDDNKFKSEWFTDTDGNLRRTSHTYTIEQLDYLKNHWNKKNIIADKQRKKRNFDPEKDLSKAEDTSVVKVENKVKDGMAAKMGRMCCGGRCMTVKQNNEVKDAEFINQTNFQGWNCMINWFFLHIEEDKNAVYHHQTCMAKLPGQPEVNLDLTKFTKTKYDDVKGPITTLTESDKYLEWLEDEFAKGRTPTMKCPNTHCGCGICIAKAKNDDDFLDISSKYIKIKEIS